jgi:hypothetical protein
VPVDQRGVVAVEAAAVRAHRHARHRFDAAADHQVGHLGTDGHRREVHALEAGSAEAVQRHARHDVRPAGAEHCLAADARALLARLLHAADDDVLDVGELELRAAKPVQRLRQQLLRMQAGESAGPFPAPAPRGADGVDDVGGAHRQAGIARRRPPAQPSSVVRRSPSFRRSC